MPRILQNPVKLSFLGLLAQFQLYDRAKVDNFCAFPMLQWSGTKSNKDSGTEVPTAIWLHCYTSLPLLPWVEHSLCSRPCTWPHVDLWRREDLNPCWAVPSWYDFQPHNYDKIPDNETHPSALPTVPGITSSIPRAAHSLSHSSCPTGRWQISLFFNPFKLNYFCFFHWVCLIRETWGLLWWPCPWLGVGTKLSLMIPSNPNHSMWFNGVFP